MKLHEAIFVAAAAISGIAILLFWNEWVAIVHAHQKSVVERSLVLFVLCPLLALGLAAVKNRFCRG